MNAETVTVRETRPDDREPWLVMYRGYRDFYGQPHDDEVVERTWAWVLEGRHGLRGLVAEAPGGDVIALANLRTFARPSTASVELFLDDLFTAPEARRTGAATALLARAAEIAGRDGAHFVRWSTAPGNAAARRLYDSVGEAKPWVTYEMPATP